MYISFFFTSFNVIVNKKPRGRKNIKLQCKKKVGKYSLRTWQTSSRESFLKT